MAGVGFCGGARVLFELMVQPAAVGEITVLQIFATPHRLLQHSHSSL